MPTTPLAQPRLLRSREIQLRRCLGSVAAMVFALSGCVAPYVYDPAQTGQPSPVSFFAGHVVTVEPTVIGPISPGVQAPAPAYAYTVAMDTIPPQIVRITQPILPEDCRLIPNCVVSPGSPVAIRVVGQAARVQPRSTVPIAFQGLIQRAALPLPLGEAPPVLSSPPRLPACSGPTPIPTCYVVAAKP